MLNVLATDEFADWFRALPDCDAEDVATALEVLGSLSMRHAKQASSDLLLWYRAQPAERVSRSGRAGFGVSDAYYRLAARIGRVLAYLESKAVQVRVTELPVERAMQVRAAISRIKLQTRGRRLAAMMRSESEAERGLEALERDYGAALEASGLQGFPAPVQEHSLRELHLDERPPGIRILYGVHPAKETVLLVLGEYLDRRAYGGSVRRALSVWERFLADDAMSGVAPPPVSGGAR